MVCPSAHDQANQVSTHVVPAPLRVLCPDVRKRLYFVLLHLSSTPEGKDWKHGLTIDYKADFVIVWSTNDFQFDQFAFQPSPVRLAPDDDIVMFIAPSVSLINEKMTYCSKNSCM